MDVAIVVCTSQLHHAQGDKVRFKELCRQNSKPLVVLLYVIICPIIFFEGGSSCPKHAWHGHSFVVYVKTIKRVLPPPLFGRLVKR